MANERIEPGDIVQVNKDDACLNVMMRGMVLNRPKAEGDCWEFKDLKTGQLWLTTEKITVFLLEKGHD
jgi:hypothetical protein